MTSTRKKNKTESNPDFPGLIPLMYELVNILPEDLKPLGNKIVGFFALAILALFAIFVIGVFVATFTGHSEQMFTIFPGYIYGVGFVAVGAITLVMERSVKDQ